MNRHSFPPAGHLRLAILCVLIATLSSAALAAEPLTITPENIQRIEQIYTFPGHTGYVDDLVFSPDGATLVTICDDRSIRLWSIDTGELAETLPVPGAASYLNTLSFSPDGRWLASPYGVHDLQDSSVLHRFTSRIMSTAFSADGSLLAIGPEMQPVQLLDTATWEVVRTFESLRHIHVVADDSFGFEFSPDGLWLADGTLVAGDARIWDVETGTLHRSLAISAPESDVHDVAFTSDGQFLAAGGHGRNILIFSTNTWRLERLLPAGEGTMSLDFSPDGRLLITSIEMTVSVWDVQTGRRLRTFDHDIEVLPVTFSPDGRYIACGLRSGDALVYGIRE